jgi:hypothetical protein
MNSLWQSMAVWQRLSVGVVALAVLLGGGLAWGSRASGRSELAAGDVTPGAVCPVEPPSGKVAIGDSTPETPDPARANEAWTASDKTELATFALG